MNAEEAYDKWEDDIMRLFEVTLSNGGCGLHVVAEGSCFIVNIESTYI